MPIKWHVLKLRKLQQMKHSIRYVLDFITVVFVHLENVVPSDVLSVVFFLKQERNLKSTKIMPGLKKPNVNFVETN